MLEHDILTHVLYRAENHCLPAKLGFNKSPIYKHRLMITVFIDSRNKHTLVSINLFSNIIKFS